MVVVIGKAEHVLLSEHNIFPEVLKKCTRNRKFRLVEILRVAPSACWTPVLPTMAAKMDPADAEALFNMFAGAGGKLDAAGLAEVMRVQ